MMELKDIVIIRKDRLELLFSRKKKNIYITSLLSIFGTLLSMLLTTSEFNPILGLDSKGVKIAIITITAIAFFIALILIIIYFFDRNEESIYGDKRLKNEILESSLVKHDDHTIILLFCKKERGIIKFAVKRTEKWDNSYFCPYINVNNFKDDFEDSKSDIKKYILDKYFEANHIPIDVINLFDSKSIKLTTLNIPKGFNFKFVFVSPISPFFNYYLIEMMGGLKFSYKSIEELIQDRSTYKYNYDIIDALESNKSIIIKQINSTERNKSKIVWNIDKTCSKGCSICAYGLENNIKSSYEDKKQIIDSLKTLHLNELDIAAGDGVDVNELKNLLLYIKNKLSNVEVSLTLTSDVLREVTTSFIIKHNLKVDITYDELNCQTKNNIRPLRYSEDNYKIATELTKNNKVTVKAHVVLTDEIKSSNIKQIRNSLSKARVKEILLIRLMPVGMQKFDTYSAILRSSKYYTDLHNNIKNNLSGIKYHCSLQGIINPTNTMPCELGVNKLGIDPVGNVYACPWAEHIQNDTDNPFKLGNILEDRLDLIDILKINDNYLNMQNRNYINQPHCKVIAYLKSGNMFGKDDDLYI